MCVMLLVLISVQEKRRTTSSGSFILGLLPRRLVIAVMIVLCFLRAFDAALKIYQQFYKQLCDAYVWD